MAYHIERRGYSACPWRIVDDDGDELYVWRDHPSDPNLPRILEPLAFDTQREALDALGRMAADGFRDGVRWCINVLDRMERASKDEGAYGSVNPAMLRDKFERLITEGR